MHRKLKNFIENVGCLAVMALMLAGLWQAFLVGLDREARRMAIHSEIIMAQAALDAERAAQKTAQVWPAALTPR